MGRQAQAEVQSAESDCDASALAEFFAYDASSAAATAELSVPEAEAEQQLNVIESAPSGPLELSAFDVYREVAEAESLTLAVAEEEQPSGADSESLAYGRCGFVDAQCE